MSPDRLRKLILEHLARSPSPMRRRQLAGAIGRKTRIQVRPQEVNQQLYRLLRDGAVVRVELPRQGDAPLVAWSLVARKQPEPGQPSLEQLLDELL